MILMPQIFDVIANENARYKRNELEVEVYANLLWYEYPTPLSLTKHYKLKNFWKAFGDFHGGSRPVCHMFFFVSYIYFCEM